MRWMGTKEDEKQICHNALLSGYLRGLADEIDVRGARNLFWMLDYETVNSGHTADSLGRLWGLSRRAGGRKMTIVLKWKLAEDKLLEVQK